MTTDDFSQLMGGGGAGEGSTCAAASITLKR